MNEKDDCILIDAFWTIMALAYSKYSNVNLFLTEDIINGLVKQIA